MLHASKGELQLSVDGSLSPASNQFSCLFREESSRKLAITNIESDN